MYIKKVFKNKYLWVSIVGIPFLVFLTYLLMQVLPYWDQLTGPEDYSPLKNYSLRSQLIISVLKWAGINSATSLLTIIFSFFLVISMLGFKEELVSYYVFGKNRFKRYNLSVLKGLLWHAFAITLAFTVGHCLVYILFNQLSPVTKDITLQSTGYLFDFKLPADFFDGHPMYYYLTTVVLNDIPIMFSYAVLCGVITLYTKQNLYLYLVIPIGFIVGSTYFFNAIGYRYLVVDDPMVGYFSRVSDIWKYTLYPLGLSLVGFIMYARWWRYKV